MVLQKQEHSQQGVLARLKTHICTAKLTSVPPQRTRHLSPLNPVDIYGYIAALKAVLVQSCRSLEQCPGVIGNMLYDLRCVPVGSRAPLAAHL